MTSSSFGCGGRDGEGSMKDRYDVSDLPEAQFEPGLRGRVLTLRAVETRFSGKTQRSLQGGETPPNAFDGRGRDNARENKGLSPSAVFQIRVGLKQ